MVLKGGRKARHRRTKHKRHHKRKHRRRTKHRRRHKMRGGGGPGTGIAPFRAFLQQREINTDSGRNWLFFGDQSEKTEYYYKEAIEDWVKNGDLYKFTTAWSRDQAEKIYVQDRLRENGPEVWEWFDSGAYFYICGDKSRMAKDVHTALIDIVEEHGKMSRDDAVHYVEKKMMREEKRYLRDVY